MLPIISAQMFLKKTIIYLPFNVKKCSLLTCQNYHQKSRFCKNSKIIEYYSHL